MNRRHYWGLVHGWSIVRLRRKVVEISVALGVAATVARILLIPWYYGARLTLRVEPPPETGWGSPAWQAAFAAANTNQPVEPVALGSGISYQP